MTVISDLAHVYHKVRQTVRIILMMAFIICMLVVALPFLCVATAFVIVLTTFIIKLAIKIFINNIIYERR